MWMVRSPDPSVSVAASSTLSVIPVAWIGKSDLPFGVFLEVSAAKSDTVPNGTG